MSVEDPTRIETSLIYILLTQAIICSLLNFFFFSYILSSHIPVSHSSATTMLSSWRLTFTAVYYFINGPHYFGLYALPQLALNQHLFKIQNTKRVVHKDQTVRTLKYIVQTHLKTSFFFNKPYLQ